MRGNDEAVRVKGTRESPRALRVFDEPRSAVWRGAYLQVVVVCATVCTE